jgi:integrase
MDELMNIKYLTQNNGYWQYERRVPKPLAGHPYWQGKAKWKHPLNLKEGADPTEVMEAWTAAHEVFESAVSNIRDRNVHIIDKRERRSRAIAHLKMFGLGPHEGSLKGINDENERNHQLEHIDYIRDHSGAFDDYVDWEQTHQMMARENGSGLMPLDDELPEHIRLQKEAWVAYTDDRELTKPVLFGDLWDIYASGKALDMSNRTHQKTKQRWDSFFAIVGDEVLTNQSINQGLRQWREAQRGRSVKDQTLRRELGVIRAVLNYARQALALDLHWVMPRLEIKTEQKEKPVIPKTKYSELLALVSDETNRKYQPWKEFALTVLCQSSVILSELMRLERSDLHLDAKTPYISLYDTQLKTKDRQRIVPLPFKTERLKALLDRMDQGQATVFPDSLVHKTSSGYQWKTSESNISHQLNAFFKAIDNESLGLTTYCTRHSFKLYLQLSGANHMDILYLAGWAGNDGQSQMLKHYGRQGIGSPEMVKRLEIAVHNAMHFLDAHNHNVVKLLKS